MFEAVFNNIDDALRKDAGCGSELDYIEQTSWILFLKYLDDYEEERSVAARLNNESYSRILQDEYGWKSWAAPKTAEGKLDHNAALTGDDLLEFVNGNLIPYLKSFRISAENSKTLEYKIGQIFHEIRNELQSGYSLREVVNKVDELSFLTNENKHELSSLYEDKIKRMGNAGRNGGEYYTPRSLIQSIVQIIDPQIGETVYDGAVGSAGFLCEAFTHMRGSKELSVTEYDLLQKNTFRGKEKKSLAYIIGIMNMILHGVEAPDIQHTNTLNENLQDIQEKDRVDVILANPPFGGSERQEVRQNFPIETGETAYLFLQHFIKMLKAGGRCGVVIKNTFLSNPDHASVDLRKQLLDECNLFAVLELPQGAFTGTGVKTVVLFFEKGQPTEKIWYYQLNLARNLGKTNPLNAKDLEEFRTLQATKADSDNSWSVSIDEINQENWDLSPNNPNVEDTSEKRTPAEILAEIEALDQEAAQAMQAIRDLL
jgi:type I restriction enzyme M protein